MDERLVLESEELELHRQRLMSEAEKLVAVVRQREEKIGGIEKELNDAQWYLGEERTKRADLENKMRWLEQKCQDFESQIHHLRTECERLQKELSDSQWYLGEERARRQEIESRLKSA